MTFEATDGIKCTVSEKIALRNFGSKKFWFEVAKTQISLDLEIFRDYYKIIQMTNVDFSLGGNRI